MEVHIEKTRTGFCSFIPEVPGVIATGRTLEEVKKSTRSVLLIYINGLRDDDTDEAYLNYLEGVKLTFKEVYLC